MPTSCRYIPKTIYPLATLTPPIMPRGIFIVLEGLDGVGKTTQVSLLTGALTFRGRPAIGLAMPDRSLPTGKRIDQYLKKEIELTDLEIHELYAANRSEILARTILPALTGGTSVVCDRYAFSGIAYSAAKGREDLTPFKAAQIDATVPMPDILVYITAPADAATTAATERGATERYETSDFQRKVGKVMEHLVECCERVLPSMGGLVVRVERQATPADTAALIMARVMEYLEIDRQLPRGNLGAIFSILSDKPVQ